MDQSNCTKWQMGTAENAVIIISTVGYCAVVLFGIFVLIVSGWIPQVCKHKIRVTIAVLCLISLLLHIPWNVINFLRPSDETLITVSFYLNRISLNVFVSAFTLLAVQWLVITHQIRLSSNKWDSETVERVGVGLWAVFNVAMYGVSIGIWPIVRSNREGNSVYEASVIGLLVFEMALAVVFILYTSILACYVAVSMGSSERAKMIAWSNGIFSVCLAFRVAGFLYRFITHCYMPYWLFWTLTYYIPEIPPIGYQFYLYYKIATQQKNKMLRSSETSRSGRTSGTRSSSTAQTARLLDPEIQFSSYSSLESDRE